MCPFQGRRACRRQAAHLLNHHKTVTKYMDLLWMQCTNGLERELCGCIFGFVASHSSGTLAEPGKDLALLIPNDGGQSTDTQFRSDRAVSEHSNVLRVKEHQTIHW